LLKRIKNFCWRRGMSSSTARVASVLARSVSVRSDALRVELSDGRVISVPLEWFPRLSHATPSQRRRWRLIAKGAGIHWEDIDEDISVDGLLAGKRSAESRASFGKWLRQYRSRGRGRNLPRPLLTGGKKPSK
jgi:hypothetical protein